MDLDANRARRPGPPAHQAVPEPIDEAQGGEMRLREEVEDLDRRQLLRPHFDMADGAKHRVLGDHPRGHPAGVANTSAGGEKSRGGEPGGDAVLADHDGAGHEERGSETSRAPDRCIGRETGQKRGERARPAD